MNYKKIIYGTIVFFLCSFIIQGILGYLIAGDYIKSITILREKPLIQLGMPATLVIGIAFSVLYPLTSIKGSPAIKGLKFGLLTGMLSIPLIALDVPSRFQVPSVATWSAILGGLGVLTHVTAGILVALTYGKKQ